MDDNSQTNHQPPSKWWLLFPVALTIVCAALAMAVNHYRTELYKVQDRYQMLQFRSTALEDDVARIRKIDTLYSTSPLQVTPTMTDFEVAVLQKKGLDDPYHNLAADLTGEPVLSMADHITLSAPAFPSQDQICILGNDRAMAHFRDGSTEGRVLLSYEVSSDGWISWKVIGQEIE